MPPQRAKAAVTGWSHHDADVNGVRLHYVQAGDPASPRPPVILLHGFPEFWYGWRHQIGPLAAAGFRVVAPDLRGYNRSSKPPRVRDYGVESLAGDVAALARRLGRRRVHLVGHDWGGVIAWFVAMHHLDVVDRLVVLNAPHPAAYLRELRRSSQLLKSWYAFFFQLPWLPETVIRFDDFAALRHLFRDDPARRGAFSDADTDRYVEALSRPGALTAPINYYRAAMRAGPRRLQYSVRKIDRPTLLIWGERDRYLVPDLARDLEPWVPSIRVERLPEATHWVQHDDPPRVNALLVDFFRDH